MFLVILFGIVSVVLTILTILEVYVESRGMYSSHNVSFSNWAFLLGWLALDLALLSFLMVHLWVFQEEPWWSRLLFAAIWTILYSLGPLFLVPKLMEERVCHVYYGDIRKIWRESKYDDTSTV